MDNTEIVNAIIPTNVKQELQYDTEQNPSDEASSSTEVVPTVKQECEDIQVKEESQEPGYINTQDLLDIGETVIIEQDRAAPATSSTVTNDFLKYHQEDLIELDDAQKLADEIREFILKKREERNRVKSEKIEREGNMDTNLCVWFDKKSNVKHSAALCNRSADGTGGGPSTAKDLTEEDLKVLAIMGDGFGEPQTTAKVPAFPSTDIEENNPPHMINSEIKQEPQLSADLELMKRQVGSWRVMLHRLPFNAGIPSKDRHLKVYTEKKTYKCEVCHYECNKKLYLRIHMTTHGEKRYKCEVCDYKCHQKRDLKIHMRIHTGEKPYKCDFCDYTCNHKCNLKTHRTTHTGEKRFKCEVCDYKCYRKRDLNIHMTTHTGEKRYKCEVCDYKCNMKFYLKIHMTTHTGEKRFKCEVCDYKCYRKWDWNIHLTTHTGEKRYKCEVCDYKFNMKCHLKTHMTTHTGEKRYKCDVCDYKCKQKSNLKSHMTTHTGEKRYKCEVCDYKCYRKWDWNNHVTTHTREKRYKCIVCDYKCNQKLHLNSHMVTHIGEKQLYV